MAPFAHGHGPAYKQRHLGCEAQARPGGGEDPAERVAVYVRRYRSRQHRIAPLLALAVMFRLPCLGALLIAAALVVGSWAGAANADVPRPGDMVRKTATEPDVSAPRVPGTARQTPAAVSVVAQDDIQDGRAAVALDEALERVPAVFVQNPFNFTQDARIAIRGFGARAAFGIRGIIIVVDDVPETLPDGQSQVDSLDLGSATTIEVMPGPSSSLYGNAAGGVIAVNTESAGPEPFVEFRADVGQYRHLKQQLKGGAQLGPANVLVNLTNWSRQGHRDNSNTTGTGLNGKMRLRVGSASSLTAVLSSVYTRADDPGGLTREQVEENRRQAAPLNLRFDGGETVAHGRLGLVYEHTLAPGHDVKAVIFGSARDFANAVPFRKVTLLRAVGGATTQYRYSGHIGDRPLRLFVGADLQRQDDQRKNNDNLDGATGDLILDQRERITALAPYAQAELSLLAGRGDLLALTLGTRADLIEFDVRDHFLSNGDASATRNFTELSSRVGVVFNPLLELGLYAQAGQSFETPTTTELADPDGGFDPNVAPQRAFTIEGGARGSVANRLNYTLSVFRTALTDELVRFEDDLGRARFRNAARSQRTGAEASLAVQVLAGAKLTVGYSLLDTRFIDFAKEGTNLAGNQIPGLPRHRMFAELRVEGTVAQWGRWYGVADTNVVGRVFADDENLVSSSAHVLANARLGFEIRRDRWTLTPYVAIRNALGTQYDANVRINASGDRFFEPGPARYGFGGVVLRYVFHD